MNFEEGVTAPATILLTPGFDRQAGEVELENIEGLFNAPDIPGARKGPHGYLLKYLRALSEKLGIPSKLVDQ